MYIDQTELLNRFGEDELTGLLGHLEASDQDAKLTAVIKDSESFINSYLSKRYPTPLANPSSQVKKIAADIARYYLWDDAPSENIISRYKEAVSLLKDVANMKADLAGATDEATATETQTSSVAVKTSTSKLNMDSY